MVPRWGGPPSSARIQKLSHISPQATLPSSLYFIGAGAIGARRSASLPWPSCSSGWSMGAFPGFKVQGSRFEGLGGGPPTFGLADEGTDFVAEDGEHFAVFVALDGEHQAGDAGGAEFAD